MLFNDFRNVPVEQKKEMGQLLNELKNLATDKINALRDALESAGYSFLSAEVEYIPNVETELTDEKSIENMEKLIDMLEDNDDVQAIWHNWSQPE